VDASNDYVQASLPGLNQTQANGGPRWSNIANSQFSPSIAAVSAPSSQFVQLDPFDGRRLRFTLTVTAGSTLVTMTYAAKGPR
jgi:gentisate 1,2-dioxygenase